MKQLDVDVSPLAIIISRWLTLTHVTFNLDPCDPWHDHILCARLYEI